MLITDEKSEDTYHAGRSSQSSEKAQRPHAPLVARPDPAPRLFPPISPSLYQHANSKPASAVYTQRLAAWLLSRGQTPPVQQMPWSKPDLSVQLGQLLWLHRCAFESELAGQFEQANLLWHTFYRRLTRLAKQSVALAQLFDQLAAAAVPAGDDDLVAPGLLLRAFVDEVLIDTHCAIYNGWARQGLLGEKSRAFAQTAYLRQLLDIASRFTILSPAEVASYQASLMQPQREAQIAAYIQAGKWKRAADTGLLLAKHRSVTARAAELAACALTTNMLYALIRARAGSRSYYMHDAKWVGACIEQLKQLRHSIPQDEHIQLLLGRLYALSAARLAQAQSLEEARESISHALNCRAELAESTSVQLLIATCAGGRPATASDDLTQIVSRMLEELRVWTQRISDAALQNPGPARTPADAPILTTKAGIWQRHVIGPRIWLRSPVDGLLKAALAVTLLLICVVGGLTLFERHTSAIRDSAYADLRQAVARGDDHAVLVQAELFFANRPIGRPDRRSQLVRTLYSQSFVDWFGTSYADQPADFQERVARYAALADH